MRQWAEMRVMAIQEGICEHTAGLASKSVILGDREFIPKGKRAAYGLIHVWGARRKGIMQSEGETGSHSPPHGMEARRPWHIIIELYCGSCSFVQYLRSQLEPVADVCADVDIWYLCVYLLS